MIVLVRHGQTEWSRTGRHTGRTDVPLTDEGRAQAAALRPFLEKYSFAAVLVSPLQRARDTAQLAGLTDRGVTVAVEPDLAEWDYGDIEGRTTDEMRLADPGWNVFDDGCPGGETIEQVGERVDRVIARCRAIEGDVALVAHAHLLRVLGARWIEAPAIQARRLRLEAAAWCELDHEHEWPAIYRWNLTAS